MSATVGTDSPVVGFYRLAAARPDRPAIIDPDGRVITFGELAGRVNRISRAFGTLGLRPGDRIAAIVHNGPEYLELALATAQVGMVLVPVNWRLAAGELRYIVGDSEARLVVADAEQAATLSLQDVHRYAVGGDVPGWLPYAELGAGESAEPPADRRAGTMMMYTSGTTGHPKGVRNALPAVDPETSAAAFGSLPARYGIGPGEGVHLVVAPLYHAAPGGHALGFLHAGHTIVIHRRFDAERTLRDIERYRVTSTHMVPTHFHRMLRLPEDVRKAADLSSLRAVVHAGAPCPVPIKQRMIEWLGPIVWEYLGSTEGYVSEVDSVDWLAKPGTVGLPTPGITVKILDDGVEVPTGMPGTIYFGVPGRPPTFEYHHDPEKTAAARHGDLVTAGDYGYLDEDGYLFLLDRRTDLIISGGVNIYPAEVEQHLITHPAVDDVAVIGVPDPEWGQQVVAVVQPVPGVAPGEDLAARLLEHCAGQLASFKRPRRFEFVTEFPRTETGKVQRRVLRDTYVKEQS
jgi:long-chain acyl-CoA synthetase